VADVLTDEELYDEQLLEQLRSNLQLPNILSLMAGNERVAVKTMRRLLATVDARAARIRELESALAAQVAAALRGDQEDRN
jgi:hypothetical protein